MNGGSTVGAHDVKRSRQSLLDWEDSERIVDYGLPWCLEPVNDAHHGSVAHLFCSPTLSSSYTVDSQQAISNTRLMVCDSFAWRDP